MKAVWTSLFLLAFLLSASCSTINSPKALSTPAPNAGTPIASDAHPPTDQQSVTPTFPMEIQTLQANMTGFAARLTLQPTRTPAPTSTPTPTCEPLPDYLTPAAALLARPTRTVTETLAVLMLQTLNSNLRPGGELPAFAVIDDPFQIEIIDGSIDPSWATTEVITNPDKTLGVFFSHDAGPAPEDEIERYRWFTSRKMWIKDFEASRVYWVKWQDSLPHRPIDIEGWATKDIFVFSQFGNPWHGFLIAIDARSKRVLLTLQLEDWC